MADAFSQRSITMPPHYDGALRVWLDEGPWERARRHCHATKKSKGSKAVAAVGAESGSPTRSIETPPILTAILNCWFLGSDDGNIFQIEVSSNESVDAFRRAIKEQEGIDHVPARMFEIWKVSEPTQRTTRHD